MVCAMWRIFDNEPEEDEVKENFIQKIVKIIFGGR